MKEVGIKYIVLILLLSLLVYFLYLDWAIVKTFLIAGIFAYIFHPLIAFVSHKTKVSKGLSIFILYLAIIGVVSFVSSFLIGQLIREATELQSYAQSFSLQNQILALPLWLRPFITDTLMSLQKTVVLTPASVYSAFPHVLSSFLSIFIFLFASFYLLKDGERMLSHSKAVIPQAYQADGDAIFTQINKALRGYLRGQIILILFVSVVMYIALLILGIKFALIIAIFSGFAEVIPIIGPITATAVAVTVSLITGANNFSLPPVTISIVIILVYFFIRHCQDYFVTPYVMGRITKVHPLIIFFAVLSGGHVFGVLGYILAVPVVAIVKILLLALLGKMQTDKQKKLQQI